MGASRLAPSPTGALHLGNAYAFVLTWALARQRGWRLPLRIEDLDTPRVKPGAIEQTVELLAWLGLDWDGEPEIQSRDLKPYRDAMHRLAAAGLAYPCELTRSEIEAAASAPQEHTPGGSTGETAFPRELRPRALGPTEFHNTETNWRFVVPDEPIVFEDRLLGRQRVGLPESIGDFVVWTKRGQPSYQLAVVLDDHAAGVTEVVRGNDLLASAARQLGLSRALGLRPEPGYWHLPLVRGKDGLRLAKRHGDTRLATWRAEGMPAGRVIGLIAWWAGVVAEPRAMEASEFRDRFNPSTIAPEDLVFDERAEQWLTDR